MSVNITVDDTSPTFIYTPWGEGGLGGGSVDFGWSTWYDGEPNNFGYNNYNGGLPRGDSPTGNSYHVTGLDGATVALTFHGTAVWVMGVSNCTFDVMLDSTTTTTTLQTGQTTQGGVLATYTGLADGDHTITLRPHPAANANQKLMLDSAIVAMDLGSNPGVQQVSLNNQNTTAIQYSPAANWVVQSDHGVPSPFYSTSTLNSSASLNFTGESMSSSTIPHNSSCSFMLHPSIIGPAVAIYGSKNWGHDLYTITMDGHTNTYNGSSYWKVGETLLYFQSGLDPSTSHVVELSDASQTSALTVTRMEVWEVPPVATTPTVAPTPSSTNGSSSADVQKAKISTGAVAAIVIVIILAALGILGWFLYRRRNAAHGGKIQTIRHNNDSRPEIGTPPLVDMDHTMPHPHQTQQMGYTGYPTNNYGAEMELKDGVWMPSQTTTSLATVQPGVHPYQYPGLTFGTVTPSESRTSFSYFPSSTNNGTYQVPLPFGGPNAGVYPSQQYNVAPLPPLSTVSSTVISEKSRTNSTSPSSGYPQMTLHRPNWPPANTMPSQNPLQQYPPQTMPTPLPGAGPPSAIHQAGNQQGGGDAGYPLSQDAVNHILDQLVSRIDPQATENDAPPTYGGDR
ncbi:hypothetical protein FRB96_009487 [Tulasnella sp. 330]|nr:hypothetical protein FRB96_009487 [Tulasnella sp. 330]